MGALTLAASPALSLPSLQLDPINPGLGLTLRARSRPRVPGLSGSLLPGPVLAWEGTTPQPVTRGLGTHQK